MSPLVSLQTFPALVENDELSFFSLVRIGPLSQCWSTSCWRWPDGRKSLVTRMFWQAVAFTSNIAANWSPGSVLPQGRHRSWCYTDMLSSYWRMTNKIKTSRTSSNCLYNKQLLLCGEKTSLSLSPAIHLYLLLIHRSTALSSILQHRVILIPVSSFFLSFLILPGFSRHLFLFFLQMTFAKTPFVSNYGIIPVL